MSAVVKPFNAMDYDRHSGNLSLGLKRINVTPFLRDHLAWYAENGYTQRDVAHEIGAVDTSVWLEAKRQGLLEVFRENKRKYKEFENEHGYPPYWTEYLNDFGWFRPKSVADLKKIQAERFWRLVAIKGENECWPWRGKKQKSGYGTTFSLTKSVRVLLNYPLSNQPSPHRVAYCLFYGGIDPELTVDHLCHRRDCMNPRHMRQCTKEENLRRTWRQTYDERPSWLPPLKKHRINKAKAADSRTSDGPISPLPDTDKHAPSDEGTSIPRRSA